MNLTEKQQRAIRIQVIAEAAGIAKTRLLKTSYSCRFCGWQSHPSYAGPRRKSDLTKHEAKCNRRPAPWPFIARSTTYRKWKKRPAFRRALDAARAENTMGADDARRLFEEIIQAEADSA